MSHHPEGFNPSDNPQRGPDPGGQGGYYPPPSYGQPPGGPGQPAVPPGYRGQPQGGSGASIDLRAIAPGGLMAVVGAALYFVFSFFTWYTYTESLLGQDIAEFTGNAWHRTSGVWSVLIFLLVPLLFVVKALKVVPRKIPLEMIALGVVVLADIFFLVAFLDVPDPVSRGWGLWIELVLVLVINVGAVLQFMKAGGVGSAQRGLSGLQERAAGQGGTRSSRHHPRVPAAAATTRRVPAAAATTRRVPAGRRRQSLSHRASVSDSRDALLRNRSDSLSAARSSGLPARSVAPSHDDRNSMPPLPSTPGCRETGALAHEDAGYHHDLHNRQMQMIAIGGANGFVPGRPK